MAERVVLCMVGLPARGKSYIARKMARYLRWLGHPTEVFNVGGYRREKLGSRQPHEFFDPANPEGVAARFAMAKAAMDDLLAYLASGGEVAIYDATNSTRARREWVSATCGAAGYRVVFVESVCHDPEVIEANVRQTKLGSPDYSGSEPVAAVADFRARIAHYESAYETVGEDEGSSVKVIDVGRQVVVNEIHGWLLGRLVFFLMNLHIATRPIYFTRHGESADNALGKIGGDAALTDAGRSYARRLALTMSELLPDSALEVWTSTLWRTRETAEALGRTPREWRALDEIDAGAYDGFTYDRVEQEFPEEWAARRADKLRYRYPRGESYLDVIGRLEPVLIELERTRYPVLVVGHQAVLRALIAYFTDCPLETAPHLPVPLHTLIRLVPSAYGCEERRFDLGGG